MSDRFEDDLMEDLMAEPEGRSGHSAMDEFEGADEYDAGDESDELDELDELEDSAEDSAEDQFESFEGEDSLDELEEAVTDALEAEDADEFWGGFRKVLKTVGNVARKVGPIAKMIPIPQAQLIGGAADLIGKVLADEGDEMDALDDLSDFADEEEAFDAFSPAIAGLAIRGALKHKAAVIPRVQRRQLVKAVSTVTRQIARKHGVRAVAAVPGLVRSARNLLVRKQLPVKHLPHLVRRAARLAVRSPRALRKFASVGAKLRTGRTAHRAGALRKTGRSRYGVGLGGYGAGGKPRAVGVARSGGSTGAATGAGYCPNCRRRTYRLKGPVTLTIQSI
jgi:hypothetical protein